MKVTTDSCLFGAWVAGEVSKPDPDSFRDQRSKLLDVGSGSGLLSLMIAQKNDVTIDAVEIDKDAAEQSIQNITSSPWKERITIYNEDVLQWKTKSKYDIIISNPPFYEGDLKSGKEEKNTAHHSTQLTLYQLLHFIKTHLAEDGKFFLLLPGHRLNELQKRASKNHLSIHQIIRVKQTTNHTPFRLMIHGSKKVIEKIVEHEISIKADNQQYTQDFISLLKDYYLYL